MEYNCFTNLIDHHLSSKKNPHIEKIKFTVLHSFNENILIE